MPLGFRVAVEEHLLVVGVAACVELRRGPVVRIVDGPSAVQTVLLTFDGAGVVPPFAATGRNRQVGLLGAGLDLVEERVAETGQMCRLLLGVGVLRLEVGDGLG